MNRKDKGTRQVNLKIPSQKKKDFQAACVHYDVPMMRYLEVSADKLIALHKGRLNPAESRACRTYVERARSM